MYKNCKKLSQSADRNKLAVRTKLDYFQPDSETGRKMFPRLFGN